MQNAWAASAHPTWLKFLAIKNLKNIYMKKDIKLEIYNAANQFIIAYTQNNKEVLLSEYGIS